MTVYLSKNNGVFALRNSATAITYDRGGFYRLALDATDTGTLGPLKIQTTDSTTHLGVWDDWTVVPAAVYDALVLGTGSLPADAAGIRTAVGLATANLDTQLADKTGYRLSATGVNDVLRTALTEGYAADGATPTLEQFMYMLLSALGEFSIAGTTITCKKLDGTTTSMVYTINDGTNPTSRTRTS
jgi:hypothetical protein